MTGRHESTEGQLTGIDAATIRAEARALVDALPVLLAGCTCEYCSWVRRARMILLEVTL